MEKYYPCWGRLFVEGASTPVVSLEMMISVRIAIPKVAKQMKSGLNR
jgi:hypothetical protein